MLLDLGEMVSQGVTSMEQEDFTRPMKAQIWLVEGGFNTGKMALAY